MAECLNCSATIGGQAYCGTCGQRSDVARLNWADTLRGIRDQFLDGDLAWLRTLRELTQDLGGVARRFNAGRRIAYVHPLKYAFYAVLIYSLVTAAIATSAPSELGDLPLWRRELATNLPLFLLLLTPIAVLTLRACFFRHPVNTIETWVLVLYALGQLSVLFVVIEVLTAALRAQGALTDTLALVLGIIQLFLPVLFFMAGVARFYRTRLHFALLGALAALVTTTAAGTLLRVWLIGGP